MMSRAASSLSSSTSDVPTGLPMALKKVYAIAPPMSRRSTRGIRFSMTSILSDTLAPPSTATNGRSGSPSACAEIAQLLLHQQPGAGLRHQPDDRLDRGVRAMRGAERVVHVDVGERGQPLREAGVVLLFLGVEAQVLEQDDAAGGALATARSAGGPMQSSANATGRPSSSPTRAATGRRLISGLGCPSAGRDARRGSRSARRR